MEQLLLRMASSLLRWSGLLSWFYKLVNKYHPSFESLQPSNLSAIVKAMQKCPLGDYYEFGIYKGFSLWFATQIAIALERTDMRFYGFDSFEGLPEPRGIDKDADSHGNYFAKGCFAADIELVTSFINNYCDKPTAGRVVLLKGYFENTLNDNLSDRYGMKHAAVVLIDCDMYASTKTVLNFITSKLIAGTIILYDDWLLTAADKGQQLACKEWLAANPGIQLEEFCEFGLGKGFRVIRPR